MIDFVSVGAIIADVAFIFVFAISVFLAYRKGFTILVFNSIGLLLGIIAVIALCKPLTTLVYENTGIDEFFSKHIQSATKDFLDEQIEKNGHINTGKTNIARPIADKINSYIDEAEENGVKNVSKYIAEKLSYIAISAIVVIVLCILARLSTFVIRAFLYFLTELPFIHTIDKAGGIIYGVLRAFFIIYIVLAVLSLLSPVLANTGIIAFINNSRICEKFYNNNVFLNILLK